MTNFTTIATASKDTERAPWKNDAEKKLTFVTQFATGLYKRFTG